MIQKESWRYSCEIIVRSVDEKKETLADLQAKLKSVNKIKISWNIDLNSKIKLKQRAYFISANCKNIDLFDESSLHSWCDLQYKTAQDHLAEVQVRLLRQLHFLH